MIQIQCHGCGNQYTVGDEMAGTRCRCRSCGSEVQIPVPKTTTPATIDFQCRHCGKRFSVSPDMAGVRAKCQGCGNVVSVPASGTPTDADALENVQADQFGGSQLGPSQSSLNSAVVASSTSSMWIAIAGAGAAVLLLCVLGVIFYFLFGSSDEPPLVADATTSSADGTSGPLSRSENLPSTPARSNVKPPADNVPANPASSPPATASRTPIVPKRKAGELDPADFPEIQLDWSVSSLDSEDVVRAREHVTRILELRGIDVVPSSDK